MEDFTSMLKIYYQRVFPFREICSWLSHGEAESLARREFGFVLKIKDEDVFLRNKSFSSFEELKKEVLKLCPIRAEIGPIFSLPPKDKDSYQTSYVPVEKELVFDIDMDAYDNIRTCCTQENVCQSCWLFLSIAIQVLDQRLRDDFGFEHILWVYSGRRGVHCWISDSRARSLSPESRAAIADYMAVVLSGKDSGTSVTLEQMHPAFREAYEKILVPAFEEDVLVCQDPFHPDYRKELLSFLPSELAEKFKNEWSREEEEAKSVPAPRERWDCLKRAILQHEKKQKGGNAKQALGAIEQIIFAYTWPRLDINVTKVMNHLLKSPFCVHPKTGKVCVPIDPKTSHEFDVDSVPRLIDIIHDIDAYTSDNNENSQDYKKTRLAPSIKYFKNDFLRPLGASIRLQKAQNQILKNSNHIVDL